MTTKPYHTTVKTLVAAWGALLALTCLTVYVSRLELGFLNVVAALSVATGKACLVLAFFMELRGGNRLAGRLLAITVFILALFIGFTFFDVGFRY